MNELITNVLTRASSTGNPLVVVAALLGVGVGYVIYEISQKENFEFTCSWSNEKKK